MGSTLTIDRSYNKREHTENELLYDECPTVCTDKGKECYHDTYIECNKCGKKTMYGEMLCTGERQCYMYECPASQGCNRYYGLCVGCNPKENGTVRLLRLVMHYNPTNVEKKDFNYRIVETEEGQSMIEYKYPTHWFDQDTFGPLIEPGGGLSVLWKCDECKEEYEICDDYL